jgi:Invasion associated locus B (IalB) protein
MARHEDSLEAASTMTSLFGRTLAVAAITLAGAAAQAPVLAQESTNRVATMTDWNVFTEESPKECWGVSKPKETVNSRDGQPVSVRRGDILLFVTFRPGKPGEISFTGGYPFAGGSTVDVVVDGNTYQLFTDGEWAWPGSAEDDAKLLAALKAGTTATLTARSGKGTQTQDTFSLRGFTAAMEDAGKRCQ